VSKWLVIDASIAHDARPGKLKFINFFNTLEIVKKLGYCVVMTPFISEEWRHVGSEYALLWRSEMISMGRLGIIDAVTIKGTCICLNGAIHSETCMQEMLKDFPLIIAALNKDKIIISKDDAARKFFADASHHIIEMKIIMWVNPNRDEEKPIQWLEAGAENEAFRQLGHFFDDRKIKNTLLPEEILFETFLFETNPTSSGDIVD